MTVTRRPRKSDQLGQHARALADPTRYAVFCYIDESAKPVGVAELTSHFGLNHNAIRQHLAKLRDAGLILEEVAPPQGPGRPALRYRPTPGAAERWDGANPYANLTDMLLELLRGAGTPFEVGASAGERLAREYGATDHAVDVVEAIGRRLGFEPRRAERRGGVDVVLDRCPFAEPAAAAPEIVCELHRGLAHGIASVAAGEVTVTGLVVKAPQRAGCRIEMQVAGPA
ncbi:MAG: helix-turn-helix transcriptional regulator [Desertimonas sp.]